LGLRGGSVRGPCCFLQLVVSACLIGSVDAQTVAEAGQARVPTLNVDTRAVILEVVVTKGADEPVGGLHQGDFQVTEDGARQSVNFFEEHTGANAPPTGATVLPPNVFTNVSAVPRGDAVNVLLVDSLNTLREDQNMVRDHLIAFLKTTQPGTPMAIFALESKLRLVQGFTGDSATLLAALENKTNGVLVKAAPVSRTSQDNAYERENLDVMKGMVPTTQPIEVMQNAGAIGGARGAQEDRGSYQGEQRIAMTAEALQVLARYLADIPGRKNLIWFASSFPVALSPDSKYIGSLKSGEQNKQLKDTADLLAVSQVAIYPVAARGVETQTWNDAGSQYRLTNDESQKEDNSHVANFAAMSALASETGGEVIAGTNDMSKALARAMQNGSHYYTLSYTPTNKNFDGKFRRIEVKLAEGRYTLAYRRGYYAFDSVVAKAPRVADPLRPLLQRGLPSSAQIAYDVRVQLVNPQPLENAVRAGANTKLSGPVTRYGVDFRIHWIDEGREPTQQGMHADKVRLELVAFDHDGKALNWAGGTLALNVTDAAYAAIQRDGVPAHIVIDVPKGEAYLATGVYDWTSNKAGTLEIPLAGLKSVAAAEPAKGLLRRTP
jgi:VWFA-related protein